MAYAKKINIPRFMALILVGIALVVVGHWYVRSRDGIVVYVPEKHRAFILDQFKQDWYWLVSEYSTDFSPEFMLDYRASSQEPKDLGNMEIYIYQVKNQPAGFVTFYKKTFYRWQLLFLYVNDAYRRLGIAQKMMEFALDEIRNKGATIVQLVTRVNNDRAQGLYKKLGFIETDRYQGFINFEKTL